MSDDVAKLKGEIKALKEKLKKKSKRVSDLNRLYRKSLDDRSYAWKRWREECDGHYLLKDILSNIPKHYYNIEYLTDGITTPRRSVCVYDISPNLEIERLREKYPNLTLVSVTKTT